MTSTQAATLPDTTAHRGRRFVAACVLLLIGVVGAFLLGRVTAPLDISGPFTGKVAAMQGGVNPDNVCVAVTDSDIRCGTPYVLPDVSLRFGAKVSVLRLPPEPGPGEQTDRFLISGAK